MPISNRCPSRSGDGFTLIEVLVTVAVLAIGLVAVLKASVLMQRDLAASRETTTACALAVAQMAEIEDAGPNNWMTVNGDFPDHPGWVWSVEMVQTISADLQRVVVTVARENGGRSLQLERLVFVK